MAEGVWMEVRNIPVTIYNNHVAGLPTFRLSRLGRGKRCITASTERKDLLDNSKEIEHLNLCDGYPNILQSLTWGSDADYHHIVYEKCHGSLEYYIRNCGNLDGDNSVLKKLIRDMMIGVSGIHGLNIVHGNLTPWNIVIVNNENETNPAKKLTAKIWNFQKSQRSDSMGNLAPQRNIYFARGTNDYYWSSPEQLHHQSVQGTLIDIFNFGCIIAFFLIKKHPFGVNNDNNRINKILNVKICYLEELQRHPELFNLIELLTDRFNRISINMAMSHPYFWDMSKKIKFLQDASEFLHSNNTSLKAFTSHGALQDDEVLGGGDWRRKISVDIWDTIEKDKGSYWNNVPSVLRLIRNLAAHFWQWKPALKQTFRNIDDLVRYFHAKFPRLLVITFQILGSDRRFKDHQNYRHYFMPSF